MLLSLLQNPIVIGMELVILQGQILDTVIGVLFFPIVFMELSILAAWYPDVGISYSFSDHDFLFILLYNL